MSPRLRRLPMLAAATVALGAPIAAPATGHAGGRCANAGVSVDQQSLAATRGATLCLLNAERARRGLKPLKASQQLRRASERHSSAMVRRRFFAHGDFLGRIRASGYMAGASSWRVGENIAWGGGPTSAPANIVRMWMNSPPHRQNILSRSYREIGIGVARGTPRGGAGGTYTTDFGARSQARDGLEPRRATGAGRARRHPAPSRSST